MSEIAGDSSVPETITLKDAVKDVLREVKIFAVEERALEVAWAKGITGRRVDFLQSDGKVVWGTEINIPLHFDSISGIYTELVKKFADEKDIRLSEVEIYKSLKERKGRTWYHDSSVGLPDKIRNIKILDLSPQENLNPNLRTIDSERREWHPKTTEQRLTRQSYEDRIVDRAVLTFLSQTFFKNSPDDVQRRDALSDLFDNVFPSGNSDKQLQLFIKRLNVSKATDIVFIHAHGGYDDIVGEQDWEVKGNETTWQANGNRIDLSQVIEEYDKPDKIGAILISTCYLGKELPPVKRVPVFRFWGKSAQNRGSSKMIGNKDTTLVSLPHE